MSDGERRAGCQCVVTVFGIGFLLLVILLPMSHQDVEYYQYGFLKRRSTGNVLANQGVYTAGRYWNGPDFTMKLYERDAHLVEFDKLPVFSSGTNESIGLEFKLDISFTYMLIKEQMQQLHEEMEQTYRTVVDARARAAIKNEATKVQFSQYFEERTLVEQNLKHAVHQQLLALHVNVVDFHLGRVEIDDKVRQMQLTTRVQNEVNDQAQNEQLAKAERDVTDLEEATINLQATRVTKLAESEAAFILTSAEAEAAKIERLANMDGLAYLFSSLNLTEQRHKASFDYLRTVLRHKSAELSTSFMDKHNVLATTNIGGGNR
eukprot:CAMPEP_0114236716 /NCGR_PEP_ID=MMETSP0058-20121206/6994_1 /TAXON_ID=36894 /ORGANISM="Pyramimonas parkeae, CCMP726" /LENGTH=319 /DNA_ID=CAMNT_0001348687 /DNA_START=134 /DNA_END=1093 /DNA_ORIENTATION=-